MRRKEAELAQQKLKKLAEQQSSTVTKPTQASSKVGDDPLEKQILEKLKKEKAKQKSQDKEEQGGGIMGFVSSIIGSSEKDEKQDLEPKGKIGLLTEYHYWLLIIGSELIILDEIVDGLRKLAEERKLGLAPQEDVVGIEEFVPDGDDEGNFWGDDEPQSNKNEEESSEEVTAKI